MVGQRETLGDDRSCLSLAGCRTDSFLRAQPRGDFGERAAPGDNRAGRTGPPARNAPLRARACQTPAVNYV